jgi:hypothetical protein
MIKRSRLKKGTGKRKQRMKKVNYWIEVSHPTPDTVEFHLWKNGSYVDLIGSIDSSDLEKGDVDKKGRLKPDVVWGTLLTMVDMVQDTLGVTPEIPKKKDIYD